MAIYLTQNNPPFIQSRLPSAVQHSSDEEVRFQCKKKASISAIVPSAGRLGHTSVTIMFFHYILPIQFTLSRISSQGMSRIHY